MSFAVMSCGGTSSKLAEKRGDSFGPSIEQQRITRFENRPKNIATNAFFNPRVAAAMQQAVLKKNEASLSHVIIATVEIEGATLDISSLSPRILNQVGNYNSRAVSAVRFSDNLSELVFFSRNPQTGEGYRAIIPLAKLRPGTGFMFPVLTGQHALKPRQIKITRITKRPPTPDELGRFQYDGPLKL